MKNIMKHTLQVLVRTCLVVAVAAGMFTAAGCGSKEPVTGAAKERQQYQAEHPDWATSLESKLNHVCDKSRGAVNAVPVDTNFQNNREATGVLGFVVTCNDGSIHTVPARVPRISN